MVQNFTRNQVMAIGENVRFHTEGLARNALRRKQAAFDLGTNSFDYNTGSSLRLRHLPSQASNYTTKRKLSGSGSATRREQKEY